MLGIGNQKGVFFPQLVFTDSDPPHEDLTINGSKPHAVKPYNLNRSIMLPHISQKSPRPSVPQAAHKMTASSTAQGSMLEAIEIYRKSRAVHSPERGEGNLMVNQSVPCPTPIEAGLPPTPETREIKLSTRVSINVTERNGPPQVAKKTTITRQPTNLRKPTVIHQPSVSMSLQKRLEKLAKHKSKSLNRHMTHGSAEPRPSVRASEGPALPALQEETTRHGQYKFKMTILPRIQTYSIRKPSLSYQLLEIPPQLTKPEKIRKMFDHSDYDLFQHVKFASQPAKKLSIVAGPETRLNAVWDYNNFLYLNVKI